MSDIVAKAETSSLKRARDDDEDAAASKRARIDESEPESDTVDRETMSESKKPEHVVNDVSAINNDAPRPSKSERPSPPAAARWIGEVRCTTCAAELAFASLKQHYYCPLCKSEFTPGEMSESQRLPLAQPKFAKCGCEQWSTSQLCVFLTSLNLFNLRPLIEAHFIDGAKFLSMEIQDFIEELELDPLETKSASRWSELQTLLTARLVLKGEVSAEKMLEVTQRMAQVKEALVWQNAIKTQLAIAKKRSELAGVGHARRTYKLPTPSAAAAAAAAAVGSILVANEGAANGSSVSVSAAAPVPAAQVHASEANGAHDGIATASAAPLLTAS